MSNNSIAILTYSHSSYFDVLNVGIILRKKNFAESITKYDYFVTADKVYKNFNTILYNDKTCYSTRLNFVLAILESKGYRWVLIDHEDMFIVGKPKSELLGDAIAEMNQKGIACARLISTSNTWEKVGHGKINQISRFSPWIYSVQPSIWDIKSYRRLICKHMNKDIWTLERDMQSTVRFGRTKLGVLSERGVKEGKYHYHNKMYPFIATAIVKGKWNFREYRDCLGQRLEEVGVDSRSRGTND